MEAPWPAGLAFWPIFILLSLVAFRMLGGSSKAYANLFYVAACCQR